MSQYQRLLLIINPALRHSHALGHAAALAKASGASLHVAALIPSWKLLSLLEEGDREQAREGYLQDHRDWLKNQANHLRDRGIEVTTEVTWADDMQQDILDHVTEMQPDLLIKQVQHESAFKRAFFTPWTGACCAIARYRCTCWVKATVPCHARSWRRSTRPVPWRKTTSSMSGSSSRHADSPSNAMPSCTCCTPATFRWCTWAIWAAAV